MPVRHPLRAIRTIVNEGLASLDAEFDKLYADIGRDSIPPERLLRAALLQAFFSIRSERQLMEQLDYNLLYRWFVGLGVDDAVWDHSVFSKNRDRLLEADVAGKFLAAVLAHPKVKPLLSDEHFSVDGTLIEAWASMKSFRAKDGGDEPPSAGRNGERDFHNEQRSNDTHASTTDPEARLYKKGKGKEAKLCFMGHALMENRHGLVVQAQATEANGTAERKAALEMIDQQTPGTSNQLTVGAERRSPGSDSSPEARQTNPQAIRFRSGPNFNGLLGYQSERWLSHDARLKIARCLSFSRMLGSRRVPYATSRHLSLTRSLPHGCASVPCCCC